MKDFLVTYKWTIKQIPATKSLDYFINSINDKIDKWKIIKPDLQISPILYYKNEIYYMPIFDIENIDFSFYKKNKIFNCYTFTGKGLHLFSNSIYKLNSLDDLNQIKQLFIDKFKLNNNLDIITTFRITPIRFFNSYSYKYNIWLWYYKEIINDEHILFNNAQNEDYKDNNQIKKELIEFFTNIKLHNSIKPFLDSIL